MAPRSAGAGESIGNRRLLLAGSNAAPVQQPRAIGGAAERAAMAEIFASPRLRSLPPLWLQLLLPPLPSTPPPSTPMLELFACDDRRSIFASFCCCDRRRSRRRRRRHRLTCKRLGRRLLSVSATPRWPPSHQVALAPTKTKRAKKYFPYYADFGSLQRPKHFFFKASLVF